ncbi:MAG: hypothetical protein LWX07_11765 [Bacteroidetes bacterium]|nr:hypothetical protein [Bacteroidota bacterium]
MTTKQPAGVNYASDDAPIKKLYAGIDELNDIIPVDNDRNRLSFCLNMYLKKEIGSVEEAIQQAQPKSSTVDFKALEELVTKKLKEKGL